jgi:hypothetical protein
MDTSPRNRDALAAGRTLEQELRLVREAIDMVAIGGSPRVVVGNLHFGEALVEPARALAADAGVRVVPLWMPDDAGADIVVERISDD